MKTSLATRWPLSAAVWALAALLCQASLPPPEPARKTESVPSSATAAEAIRAFLGDMGHPYRESRSGDTSVFSFALAVDVDHPLIPVDILVPDGSPSIVSRARLPERIPSDRRRDVAQCLLDLNRQRAAGSYRLDWRKRRVYCEFSVPARSFSPGNPAAALLFVAGPLLWLDEDLPVILSAAGLLAGHGGTGTGSGSASTDAALPALPAPAAVAVIPGSDSPEAGACGDAPAAERPWVAHTVQKALERQGCRPIVDGDSQKTTFQFPSILRGSGLFSRVTVSLSATQNWVYLLLSPDVRVSGALRAPVAEWAMRVTPTGSPAAFAWQEEVGDLPRIAAKTVCPAQAFADDPDRALLALLQDAAAAFDRNSRSFAAVLSGLLPPAKALSAAEKMSP